MTTSHVRSLLSEVGRRKSGDDAPIPEWMLEYARQLGQQEMHSLVLSEYRKSGITQATLAKRLGKDRADVICRNLKSPANWRSDTFVELLFAISGKLPHYAAVKPTQAAKVIFSDAGSSHGIPTSREASTIVTHFEYLGLQRGVSPIDPSPGRNENFTALKLPVAAVAVPGGVSA